MDGSVCIKNFRSHRHEGETYFSTQYPPSRPDARLPGSHGDQERAPRAQAAARKGSQAADRQQPIATRVAGLTRDERIRRRIDYQRVYERGTRIHGRLLTLFTLSNQLPVGRLGIAATKKLGGAVLRNRAKRLIREAFRRNKLAPGVDVVIVPKRDLLDASLTAIETEFRQSLARSLRRPSTAPRV
jgi:ribonuclease P protein component